MFYRGDISSGAIFRVSNSLMLFVAVSRLFEKRAPISIGPRNSDSK